MSDTDPYQAIVRLIGDSVARLVDDAAAIRRAVESGDIAERGRALAKLDSVEQELRRLNRLANPMHRSEERLTRHAPN